MEGHPISEAGCPGVLNLGQFQKSMNYDRPIYFAAFCDKVNRVIQASAVTETLGRYRYEWGSFVAHLVRLLSIK